MVSVPLSYLQNANWYYDAYYATKNYSDTLLAINGKLEKEVSIGMCIVSVFTVLFIFEAVEIGVHWK
jgi:hypothetical protein